MMNGENYNKKQRLNYLDITKGFAIILVILGHIFNGSRFERWISSFHMPLFFIISGCLLKYNDCRNISLKEFIGKRINGLIIPYIYFSILNAILIFIINGFVIDDLLMNILYVGIGQSIYALWFLPALFISEIIFFILSRYIKNSYKSAIVTLIILSCGFLINYTNYNVIMLVVARAFIATGFVAFGYYLFNFIKNIKLSYKSVVMLIVLNIVISQFNVNIDLWSLQFGNIGIYVMCSILGSISTILFFKNLGENKLLYYWGKNSLIIMATHQILMQIICTIFNYKVSGFLSGIFLTILVILIEYLIIEFINNKMTFLLGKKRSSEDLSNKGYNMLIR